uniref:Uncharacterized protein n=1 Tax=Sipha flava TaxID=143950 RepID=A0A2S2PVL8_9HEMI
MQPTLSRTLRPSRSHIIYAHVPFLFFYSFCFQATRTYAQIYRNRTARARPLHTAENNFFGHTDNVNRFSSQQQWIFGRFYRCLRLLIFSRVVTSPDMSNESRLPPVK